MKISRNLSRLFLCVAVYAGGAAAGEDRGAALVLGDSVAFGYISTVGYEYFYTKPENFFGFADDLGRSLGLDVVNAACPGETSGSFISSAAQDNGCREYRELYPLHEGYKSAQLDFATQYLHTHRDVRLVTITLGANDAFLLEASCASYPTPQEVAACIEAGVPGLLSEVAGNLGKILYELRTGGYSGAIVLTNYYSLDYSDTAGTALTAALNSAIEAPAKAYGAVVANVFSAYQRAASTTAAGGKTCNTGLLNPDVYKQFVCNIHPTRTGHRLIAEVVTKALRTAAAF